jgi:transposase
MLERVIEPMLRARETLRAEYHALHRAMLAIVRGDTTCRRLMTVPGVGAVVAITFTSAIDDPGRFARSRAVGAHFGLTPKKYQSGETDVTGGISKVGDAMVRSALYEAANVMLTRAVRCSGLNRRPDFQDRRAESLELGVVAQLRRNRLAAASRQGQGLTHGARPPRSKS